MPRALITGITGQDGSYLAELLLEKGYDVHGLLRHSSSINTSRISHLKLNLHYGDLSDSNGLSQLVRKVEPTEIYHLGAQSHVRTSFDSPKYTADITGLGTLRLLDAIVQTGVPARFYQASSSEIFGNPTESPQRETTPLRPRSPYGCAKAFAHWTTINYREAYGVHASNGILFNHESPRRGDSFVTRKITRAVARIARGSNEKLQLGNLEAKRDWGFAKEYVEAMWLMLQMPQADDYVIATGETHSVREFLELAFGFAGLNWKEHVEINPDLFRPTEVDQLAGDASKARQKLGWKPRCSFEDLVKMMVEADCAASQ